MRMWSAGVLGVVWTLRASAAVLVPMADADLVGIADLVVVGSVGEVRTILLDDARIVTRVTLAVDETLKGVATEPTVVITETGGAVDGRVVVIDGAPEYTTGERVLAFLRRRPDGSLRATAGALGVYHLTADAPAVPLASRSVPAPDVRAFATMREAVRDLARAQGGGVATNGRAGIGSAASRREIVTASFTFNASNLRWFEGDCGIPIPFSRANADTTLGDAASESAVAGALAAWAGAAGATISLEVGPATTPASSVFEGDANGVNAVVFNDPFNEVADVVGCTGAIALGGYTGLVSDTFVGFQKVIGGVTYGRILEGDVVIDPAASACLSATGVAEVVTHEVGHAIGFAHSSENPGEADPVLADATMFFQAHDDGRGAAIADDDVLGMQTVYPSTAVAPDAIAAIACRLDLGIFATACFEQELAVPPFARFDKARAAVAKAVAATTPAKQKKQIKKVLRALKKTDKGIAKFITGACGDAMRAIVATRTAEVTAILAQP